MLRMLTAVTLLISFLAMASSGLLMYVIEEPSFAIRMNPVHKGFSLVMIGAATTHIVLHRHTVLAHLRRRAGALAAGILAIGLMGTYAASVMRQMPSELAHQMDKAARQAKLHR